MRMTSTTLVLLLASSSVAMASPALAQYGSSAPPPKITVPTPKAETPAAEAPTTGYQPTISSSARKEIVELQTVVNAKDTANIPAKLAAAQAKAKTKDDRYVIGQLQLKAAVDAQNNPAIMTAIEAVLAAEALPVADT